MIEIESNKQVVRDMTSEQIIAACKWLDKEQKMSKKLMDSYKAELQARGLKDMTDHNIRYIKFYADEGTAAVTDSMSLDVLNPKKLRELVGEGVYDEKVKVSTEVKYRFDRKFERVLKAIFVGDYTFECTLEEFLDEMSIKPDVNQKKLLLKKLKGEFGSDKDTLVSILAPEANEPPNFDVELYYIYQIKNAELIRAFLPDEFIDETIAEIRKAIFVETKTAITMDYKED